MKIWWIRDQDTIGFNRPNTWFVIGRKGAGKSACLEHIGEGYLAEGNSVLDMFGSRDGEGLAWLRSEHAKDKKILLVHGDNVSVSGSFDTRGISKLNLNDFNKYDILISASPLYSSMEDEYFHINHMIDTLYNRLEFDKLTYMIVREAGNLLYSRLRVSPNQLIAKAETTYLIREGRHCGIALGLDTLKYTTIESDIRVQIDFTIFKSLGIDGFPDSRKFLYGFLNPAMVRNMPAKFFFIVSAKGPIGVGRFPCPPWHKQERENIVKAVGLKIERGEVIDYGKNRGAFKTVGDEEHVVAVDEYFNGSSMCKLARKLGRSSATIMAQVHSHDDAIEKNGYCYRCRRLKGKHEAEKTR